MSMAKPEKNHGFINSYSSITENEKEGLEDEEAVPSGCFTVCCFKIGRRKSNQEIKYLLHPTDKKESWFLEKVKKLKEFSEVIAGPKWKNFVRKVGKHYNPRKQSTAATTNWMYSPTSYAMNFDEGPEYEEDDNFLRSFSSRFSAAGDDQSKNNRGFDNSEVKFATVKAVVL